MRLNSDLSNKTWNSFIATSQPSSCIHAIISLPFKLLSKRHEIRCVETDTHGYLLFLKFFARGFDCFRIDVNRLKSCCILTGPQAEYYCRGAIATGLREPATGDTGINQGFNLARIKQLECTAKRVAPLGKILLSGQEGIQRPVTHQFLAGPSQDCERCQE